MVMERADIGNAVTFIPAIRTIRKRSEIVREQ